MADQTISSYELLDIIDNEHMLLLSRDETTYAITYKTLLNSLQNGMLSINLGIEHAGKMLVVDEDGFVKPMKVVLELISKLITENGIYNPNDDNADGYSLVTVSVESNTGEKEITTNGTYNSVNDGLDGYSTVSVNVAPNLTALLATHNGTFNPPNGKNGFSLVTVSVPTSTLGTKTITSNGVYQASNDNVDGYSIVSVNVASGSATLITKNIAANGTYSALNDNADGYSAVTVSVPSNVGTKNIITNGTYNASADGFDGYSRVTVSVNASDESAVAGIINRTATSITNSAVTWLQESAFYGFSDLSAVSFPNCSFISDSAFYECYSLTTASFDTCTEIGSYAFAYLENLSSVYFPVCTTVYNCAFQNCSALSSVNMPSLTTIGSYAFEDCGIQNVTFPVCTEINEYGFRGCNSLSIASLPACTYIGRGAFDNCYSLSALYLIGSSVCEADGDVLYDTPIYDGQGSIYVPASLVSAYCDAYGWSEHSTQILPV